MIENYKRDENGVIKQESVIPIHYNMNYVENSYIKYGELSNYISYLRYGYLIGLIKKVPTSILDFGYGSGAFLDVAKKTIPNCYGYDIGEYDVPNGCDRITNIFEKHFDVVCFFDSLEHVEDIYFLNKINCDYVMISVPECHYHSDEWFESWKHRRENEHIWHFSRESLINFMKGQEYDLIYVSNIEDVIRISVDDKSNILTGIFKKIK
jgi:hypothetical protein